MRIIRRYISMVLVGLSLLFLSACAPEIGSEEWCEQMKAKPKGDWTTNQAVDFAKHCILK